MQPMYYIGLDVHKKKISYCVKDGSGQVYKEGEVPATRWDLDRWMKTLPQPWSAAMEATIFTGWIYDHLKPHAAALKVAHPLMLRAIAAAKKKNDRIDANKICDCLRCDFLPECYMAPTALRECRRTLRYRNLLVRQMVQMKNKIAVLLMEAGVGLWGFLLHARANLQGPSVRAFDNFIYGAPPMAPLLFPNLVVLGIIALWQFRANGT